MRTLLVGFLMIFSVCASAADTMTMHVNAKQKQFLVTLPANPTTGYQWALINYDKSLLKLTKSHYLPPTNKFMGAGGQMQFGFKLIKGKAYPSKTTLQFKYQRPWESKSGTLKTVIINFQDS
jgi:inhibitor of cysteine peptidase